MDIRGIGFGAILVGLDSTHSNDIFECRLDGTARGDFEHWNPFLGLSKSTAFH